MFIYLYIDFALFIYLFIHLFSYLFICSFDFKPLDPINTANMYMDVGSFTVVWAIYHWPYPKDCDPLTPTSHQLPIAHWLEVVPLKLLFIPFCNF